MSMWNLLSNWFGSWLQADASRCDSVPNLPGIGIDYGDCTSGESARDDSYSGFSAGETILAVLRDSTGIDIFDVVRGFLPATLHSSHRCFLRLRKRGRITTARSKHRWQSY